jgi:hypothetical protein
MSEILRNINSKFSSRFNEMSKISTGDQTVMKTTIQVTSDFEIIMVFNRQY